MQEIADDRSKYVFGKGERIRHALDWAGVSIGEIADELEVHRNTVGSWLNDRNSPRVRELRRIAMRTGFSLRWLEHGVYPDPDSNREPTDYKAVVRDIGPLAARQRTLSRPPLRADSSRPNHSRR